MGHQHLWYYHNYSMFYSLLFSLVSVVSKFYDFWGALVPQFHHSLPSFSLWENRAWWWSQFKGPPGLQFSYLVVIDVIVRLPLPSPFYCSRLARVHRFNDTSSYVWWLVV